MTDFYQLNYEQLRKNYEASKKANDEHQGQLNDNAFDNLAFLAFVDEEERNNKTAYGDTSSYKHDNTGENASGLVNEQITSGYVLGVHSNKGEGDGSNVDELGHAWITINNPENNASRSIGLWPDNHPYIEDNGDLSDVRMGIEAPTGRYNRYYNLTPDELDRLQAYIAQGHQWGYLNNCSSFAEGAVDASKGLDLDADDWFGIETPRELGRSIQNAEEEDPTAIGNPTMRNNNSTLN